MTHIPEPSKVSRFFYIPFFSDFHSKLDPDQIKWLDLYPFMLYKFGNKNSPLHFNHITN